MAVRRARYSVQPGAGASRPAPSQTHPNEWRRDRSNSLQVQQLGHSYADHGSLLEEAVGKGTYRQTTYGTGQGALPWRSLSSVLDVHLPGFLHVRNTDPFPGAYQVLQRRMY